MIYVLYCCRGSLKHKCIYFCMQLRSRIRAEVFHSMESQQGEVVPPPPKPEDVFLSCELVRELLMSLGLNNSLSVFQQESGQPSEMRIDRRLLASELGFRTNEQRDRDVPLLLLIVRMLKEMKMKQIDDLIV